MRHLSVTFPPSDTSGASVYADLVLEAPGRRATLVNLDVLDLGSGTGAMLPYYATNRTGRRLTGVEPDPTMLRRAAAKADRLDVDCEFVHGRTEALAFPADRFDVVVASLVLCSVDDLVSALQEIERVLAPDGEFRFFEHVRSAGLRGRAESAVAPYWRPLAGGCRIDRRTDEAIRERFDVTDFTTHDIGSVHTFPVRRFVRGRASLA